MSDLRRQPSGAARSVRRVARIWSLASIAFVLLFFAGEALMPSTAATPTHTEWVGLFFFPFGVCLGMILGWRNEGWGGAIAVASLGAFYVWNAVVRGRLPGGPYFILVAAPGFLFLLYRYLSR